MMEVRALINDDHTEASLFFPEPHPGYTLTMKADPGRPAAGASAAVGLRLLLQIERQTPTLVLQRRGAARFDSTLAQLLLENIWRRGQNPRRPVAPQPV